MNTKIFPLLLGQTPDLGIFILGNDWQEVLKAKYDAVIVNALDKKLLEDNRFEAMLDRISQCLTEKGDLCIIFCNKFSYAVSSRDKASYSLSTVEKRLEAKQFRHRRIYAIYPDDRKIIPLTGIGTLNKNAALNLKQLIKNKVFHSRMLQGFQPAYAIVAGRSESNGTVIENIVSNCCAQAQYELIAGNPATAIILTDDCVVRMPLDRGSAARCRINRRMLKQLHDTRFAPVIPRFVDKGEIGGKAYYRETRISGLAIDIPIKEMKGLVQRAAQFITEFQTEFSQTTVIDDTHFRRLFARPLRRLVHYGNDAAGILRLMETLQKRVWGREFKTVWTHGDYKIENVLFDKALSRITGIIDWDLSQREGLPLLDILYLLLYRDSLTAKRNLLAVANDRFLATGFDASGKAIIDNYLHAIGIPHDLVPVIESMFLVHHITRRCKASAIEASHYHEVVTTIETLCASFK